MKEFQGKVAVVTGAASGIGRALAIQQFARQALASGMPPRQVADIVFQAIRDETFYILTHPEMKEAVRARMEDILEGRNPTNAGLG